VSTAKEERKTFVARADLLTNLLRLARNRGMTLYTFVNQVFEAVLELENKGIDLRKAVAEWRDWSKARSYGLMLVPATLWYSIVEEAYNRFGDLLLQMGREAGEWLGKRIVLSVQEPVKEFEHIVELLALGSPELTFKHSEGHIKISIANPKLGKACAELFAAILEGALKVLGYTVVEKDVGFGHVRIEATGSDHAR